MIQFVLFVTAMGQSTLTRFIWFDMTTGHLAHWTFIWFVVTETGHLAHWSPSIVTKFICSFLTAGH